MIMINQSKKNREIFSKYTDVTYPVEDLSPALESDALEDGQHGVEEVVEVGDAVVWSLPILPTLRAVGAVVGAPTRDGLLHHLVRVDVEAGLVKDPWEELQPDDGVDKNDKDDEECDVEERDHGHDYTIEYDL